MVHSAIVQTTDRALRTHLSGNLPAQNLEFIVWYTVQINYYIVHNAEHR